MDFPDYYATLGVPEDADAKAVKAAYRRLARKYHPDVSKEADAEAKFKEVGEAYAVLGDQEKRTEYDHMRRYGQHSRADTGGASGTEQRYEGQFSDLFEDLFGGAARQAGGFSAGGFSRGGFQTGSGAGQDVELELALFLEEVVTQEQKEVRFSLRAWDEQGRPNTIEKSLKVRLPRGISDGERIRLKGQGGPGFNGGPNGDLYLKVRFAPHPLFDVDGHNLVFTLPLAPWEAALGTRVEIPTLSGRLELAVPANSRPGARLRLKGKGLPGRGADGDLYAQLKIVLPERSAAGDEALWRALAEHHPHFNPRAQWHQGGSQ